ncbi:COG1361 S-layer family protein [Nocardiopsis halophila]|uniref:COG1361 S-layer family protein n=1 Tax=Nocardiopsis halophila TaxID=141692 RepID=UPI0003448A9E|nr:DUF11 domain-containing protein [Nocardiopsis halophila]
MRGSVGKAAGRGAVRAAAALALLGLWPLGAPASAVAEPAPDPVPAAAEAGTVGEDVPGAAEERPPSGLETPPPETPGEGDGAAEGDTTPAESEPGPEPIPKPDASPGQPDGPSPAPSPEPSSAPSPAPAPEPSPEADEDDVRESQAAAQLQISKSVEPNPMIIGDEATYTITVTNTGDEAAEDVTVTDTLASDVSFVSASAGCSASGQTVTCGGTGTTVGAGETLTYSVTVKVDPGVSDGTNITNPASVEASNTGGASTQNIAQTQTMTDVEITKSAEPATVNPDGTITYTITVTNHGPSEAVDVTVHDPTDGNLVSITGLPDRCPPGGLTISCDLGTLAPGETVELTVTVTVNSDVADGTQIQNCATVYTGSRESDTGNNVSCASNEVGPGPAGDRTDLELTKDGPATVSPDGTITYTIRVTNTGPVPAENVHVFENFDTENTTVESLPAQCTLDGEHVGCDIGDLQPGESTELTVVLRANADADPGTLLENCAVARTATRDGQVRNNAACVQTEVVDEDPGPDPSPSPSPSPDPSPSPTPSPEPEPSPSPTHGGGPTPGPGPDDGPDGDSDTATGDGGPGLPVTGAGAAGFIAAGLVTAGGGLALAWSARRRVPDDD